MAFKVIIHHINDRCFIEIQNTIFDVREVVYLQDEKNIVHGHYRYGIVTNFRNGYGFQLLFNTRDELDIYKNAVRNAMLNLEAKDE